MEWHFANALETIADLVPNRVALVNRGVRRTWAEYENRAARIASVLQYDGVTHGSKVGLLMHNSNEYLESHLAVFKLCATPINVNYRYKADELVYLLDNADVDALVFHEQYCEIVEAIRPRLPKIRSLVQVSETAEGEPLIMGAMRYETAIRNASPLERTDRLSQDIYLLYTGGTTGMPKGVIYENGALCEQLAAGYRNFGMPVPSLVSDMAASLKIGLEKDSLPVSLAACPLMHGTGIWIGAMTPQLAGGSVVTITSLGLDPDLIWKTVEAENVTYLTIVGDAFAKPLLRALDEAESRGQPYDLSRLRTIVSSGVMWSLETKEGLLRHADLTLVDAMGSSEASMGGSVMKRGRKTGTGKFKMNPGVKIISESGEVIAPTSQDVGMIATPSAMIGYYKDEQKTAETIRQIEGKYYVILGDFAHYGPDGDVQLLGRGSMCINTAGEKVFPEEVEEAIKKHCAVRDCLVVGMLDERFGQRVVAVVSLLNPLLQADLLDHTKALISGFKVPKEVLITDHVQRSPNGKADYKWAKQYAQDYAQA